jgi:hypothetical protein
MYTKKSPRLLFILFTIATLILVVLAPLSATAHDPGDPVPAPSTSAHLNVLGQYEVDETELTSDVWALGNYAYTGSFSSPFCSFDLTGIRIIDISDPTDPQLVAFIKDKQGTRTNDVKAASLNTSHWSGDILVSTNEGCGVSLPRLNSDGNAGKFRSGQGGINIYDVTDPTKPHALKQNFLPKANGGHNTYIWEDGAGNAYLLAVDDVALADVIVVDITNPASPKEIARTGQADWPSDIASEIEGPAVFLHDVWVQDGIAYLSYWDAGLVLLDVSDPANPVFLGDSTYPNPDLSGLPPEGNGHVAVPNADGSLVIFGDEDQSKAASFLDSTIDAVGATDKIGVALFGPEPLANFPEPSPVPFVAGSFGCSLGDFGGGPGAGTVLIERGDCFFSTKAANAQAAGYDSYIVFNDAARGDALTDMSPSTGDVITIPGIFVGNTLGMAMAAGTTVTVDMVFGIEDGEGFMRVFDVTDPANIVQIGTYATERTLPPENALAMGTRDAHNVVVDGDLAYWAWYYEGIRVVDFSDCDAGDGFGGCTPVEIAHYDGGEDPDDIFWGVYVHTLPSGQKVVLGSAGDRGLFIFDTP